MAVDLLVVYNAPPWLKSNDAIVSRLVKETPLVTQFEKGFECELPGR